MRPTAHPQSAFRMPLNDILGTEASVRLLRVLATQVTSVSVAELARQAGLERSGVHRALLALENTGVVEFVGNGAQRQVILRDRGPLVPELRSLFTHERARLDALIDGLRDAMKGLSPPPRSVWLSRESVDNPDFGHPIELHFMDKPDTIERIEGILSIRTEELQLRLDIEILIDGWTVADLEALPRAGLRMLHDPILIAGVQPSAFLDSDKRTRVPKPALRSHADHDRYALDRARLIADMLKRDPTLVPRALEFIESRMTKASPAERKTLGEWSRILKTASPARLRKLLVDPGERATRLRQSLPFVDALRDTK